MRVTYDLAFVDFHRYSRFLRRRSTFVRFVWPFGLVGFLALAVYVGVQENAAGRGFAPVFASFGVLVVVASWVIGAVVNFINAAYRFSRQEHLHGENTLEVRPEGLRYSSPTSEGTIFWDGVRDIAEDRGSIYFFVGRGAAIIVPKRCLTSKEESEELVETARAYKRDSEPRWETVTGT